MIKTILPIIVLLFSAAVAQLIQEVNYMLGEDLQGGLSEYRQIVLRQNAFRINKHNSDASKTWKLQLYPQFAALTQFEVRQKYLTPTVIPQNIPKIQGVKQYQRDQLKLQNPLSFEYVNLAAVYSTPVRNQGVYRNSAIFATIGTVDLYLKSKRQNQNYPFLSTQHLIDCSRHFYNNGRGIGNLFASYYYLHLNGVASEKAYPERYNTIFGQQLTDTKCLKTQALRYKIDGFYTLGESEMKPPNEADCFIHKNLLRDGYPLTVSLSVSFQVYFYKTGIISNCTMMRMMNEKGQIEYNHNVVMVGFQSSPVFQENYVILKNSWGNTWGDNGYLKVFVPPQSEGEDFYDSEGIPIDRNIYNKCYVCNYAYVPV